MITRAEKLQKKIDAQIAKITKCDEQIGRLMSRRIDMENALGELYKTQRGIK